MNDPAPGPSTSESPRPAPSLRADISPVSNALLYLGFCLLAATGLAMTFRLDTDRQVMLWLDKQGWARVHAVTALSVLSLVVLHLWLNWGWIRSMLSRVRWTTVLIAAVGFAMVVLAALAPVR